MLIDPDVGDHPAGAADHPVRGLRHLVHVAALPRRHIREAVSAESTQGSADHVGDRLGLHLHDPPAVGPIPRRRFVETDVRGLNTAVLNRCVPGRLSWTTTVRSPQSVIPFASPSTAPGVVGQPIGRSDDDAHVG
jgi:hypothetical protein